MAAADHTDVLIVGAGPSGLMTAAQLLRYGIQPLIIDAKRGPDSTSAPVAVNARTMELFRQLGLADQLSSRGVPSYAVPVLGGGRPIGTIASNRLESPGTAFPFDLLIGGDRLERLLLARLTEKACPVVWNTRLVALQQDDRGATAWVERDGASQQWSCGWVVGADGIDSVVRDSLALAAEVVFACQRCFLVGGAARVAAFPDRWAVNTGMQDTANLAWKLAGVIEGRLRPQVLHSYAVERNAVPQRTWAATWAWLGDSAAAWIMRLISRRPQWLRRVFAAEAQLSLNYRHSPLSVHHAMGGRTQAGDRLPYLPVFDEKMKTQTDLHRWCEKPGFILLVMGTISPHHLNIIGQWMRQKYPRGMHLYYLPYSPGNQPVFDAFETRPTGTKIVLIRPDMHIGYINDMLNVGLIDTYMEEVIGWRFATI